MNATQIRAKFATIIILHTDEQLESTWKTAFYTTGFDASLNHVGSKNYFLELLQELYGDSPDDLGKHEEVVNAIAIMEGDVS